MDELTFINERDYIINEHIHIHNPTLQEIVDYGEREYFAFVSCLCGTPADYKVPLFDNFGIDYEAMNEFEFFYSICKGIRVDSSSIFFGDKLDLSSFTLQYRDDHTDYYMVNPDGVVIDRAIYILITDYLRKIHGYKKNIEIAGNEHTKQYLIERDRRNQQHSVGKPYKSMLVPLVSSMATYSGFKYNYDTVWKLTINQLMDAVQRVQKFLNYEHLMGGLYAGTVDSSKVSQDDLNWMS